MQLRPNVLLVPECSRRDAEAEGQRAGTTFRWTGENPRKGLAAFVDSAVVELPPALDETIHYGVAVAIMQPIRLNVLGVWASRGAYRPRVPSYSEHLRRLVAAYSGFLSDAPSIVAGDFNSSAIWDRPAAAPHHDIVVALDQLGLDSCYHRARGEAQGAETTPTFYLWRKLERSFHIDYCFASRSLLAAGFAFDIGRPESWLRLSDHMPLVLNIRLP